MTSCSVFRFCFVALLIAASVQLYAQGAIDQINGRPVAAGAVLVKFRSSDAGMRASARVLVQADSQVHLSHTDQLYLFQSRSQKTTEIIRLLRSMSDVEYVEPNYLIRVSATPNDPSFSSLWGMNKVGAPTAWNRTTGSTANLAGIIDTGIDYNHPDLAGNVWSAPSSFTVNVNDVNITCPVGSHGFNAIVNTCDPMDDAQHGTHVSGTVGAIGNNGTGVSGLNWATRMMGLKFMDASGNGYVSDAIKAIDFAIQVKSLFGNSANMRVLSASWGTPGFSQALSDAISRANAAEMLFVAAAGNSSSNNDLNPEYPAGYSLPNVISVAATDSNDALASFSNFGSTVHLGAPGVSIYSTVPFGYRSMSGTSMAAPHVSGAAMLLLSACQLSTSQLRTTLLQNTDPISVLSGYTSTGGRLNVAKALAACSGLGLQFIPLPPCRVLDTRNADSVFGGPAIAAGTSRSFVLPASGCGIPSNAVAYSINVTVVPTGQLGYLTVWPTGQNMPTASTVNALDARIKANAAIVPAGNSGAINIFASDSTHVIVDTNGYFVPVSGIGLSFFPMAPCRVLDTRIPSPFGGPALVGGAQRSLPVGSTPCNVPGTALAYSLNFTAVPHGTLGYLTAWPTGSGRPLVSTLNSPGGQITSNAAIVPAGTGSEISVYATQETDLVIDINGYFAPAAPNSLLFYALTPCRALDTRLPAASAPIDGTRVVTIAGNCAVPSVAQGYVLNATVVPPGSLGYLTLWPEAQVRPLVSTLNAVDGAITSNMAIVPTSTSSISAFVSNPTHLVLDISGYFAP